VIILDEHLNDARVVDGFRWYPGGVHTVQQLAGFEGASDELIPRLLRRNRDCIFVTINVRDFWEAMDGDPMSCVVAVDVVSGRAPMIPVLVRRLLRVRELSTKTGRRGPVIHVQLGANVRGPAECWPAEAHYYTRRSDLASRGAVVLPEL
jgi:hypothetical protein